MRERSKRVLAILLLLALTLVLFNQVLAHPTWLVSAGYDLVGAYTPWKYFFYQSFHEFKQLPLWYPQIFSGTPFLGNLSVAMFFYPANLLFILLKPEIAYAYIFMFHIFFAGISMYFLLRFKSITRVGSLIGAVSFMLSGAIMAKLFVGSVTETLSICWLPAIFLLFELMCKRKRFVYAVLLGIGLALQFHVGMIRNYFYCCLSIAFYFVYMIFSQEDKRRLTMLFVSSVAIAMMLSSIHLLPALQLANYATRNVNSSYEVSVMGSMPPWELINYIFPNFFGSWHKNTYWGTGGWWELEAYIGVLGLLLACVGLVYKRKRENAFYILLGLFWLLHAFGKYTPFFSVLYLFPIFKLFRIPGSTTFILSFCLSIFAGYGTDYITSLKNQVNVKKLGRIIVLIGIVLLLGVPVLFQLKGIIVDYGESMLLQSHIIGHPEAKPIEYYQKQILGIHKGILLDVLKAGVLVLSAGFVLLLLKNNKNWVTTVKLLLLVLVITDMLSYALPMVYTAPPNSIFVKSDLIKFIEKDDSLFRVYDLKSILPHHFSGRYGIQKVTGYDPLMLSYYVEYTNLISGHKGVEPTELPVSVDLNFALGDIQNWKLLDLLNAKYIISDTAFVEADSKDLELVYLNPAMEQRIHYGGKEWVTVKIPVYVYLNHNYFPRAFIVHKAEVIV
ncbi:YfhO family protein, partial [Candidatus Woesearchaeota archaeon]|nr:YfhO family protein [Candidatus Woesearchaeota archaeon]